MRTHLDPQGGEVNARGAQSGDSGPERELTERERIWQVVAGIPEGMVATYGQVAEQAGLPGGARLVGRVLGALPSGGRLPWHRVLNAQGRSSLPAAARDRQLARLRDEGVAVVDGRVSLARYRWMP